jgi:hypothetical protein
VMAFACALLIVPQLAPEVRERDELQRLRDQLVRRKSSALVSAPSQAATLASANSPVATTSASVKKPPVATLPSPSPETKSEPPPPPTHQHWGADIEWPKEWSQSGTSQEKASQQGDEKASQQGDEKKEP